MSAKRKLDLASWPRKEHFEFFGAFEEPYYGVTASIDCTAAYRFAKASGVSFFLYYTYQSLAAAQRSEPFRMRIEDDGIFIYDRIDAGAAIDRPDGTYTCGLLPYRDTLEEFIATAKPIIAHLRTTTGLNLTSTNNVIRYSTLPWIDFLSLSHARAFSRADSAPRITFGKMTERDGKRSMPLSVHVNHAVVDGRHVGEHLELFQQLMNSR